MSFEITFSGAADQEGEETTFFLCSTGAWGLFASWVATLPAGRFPTLHTLADTGAVTGTDALSRELRAAPRAEGKGVAATRAALAKLVGVGAADETATITD